MANHDKTSLQLIATVNAVLAGAASDKNERMAIISITDDILLKRGLYNGFQYLSFEEMETNGEPGIRWVNGNPVFTNTDPSRRRYI